MSKSFSIDDRNKARLLMQTTSNKENNRNFSQKLRKAKRTIRREKRIWEKERIKQIKENKINPKLFFKQTKKKSGICSQSTINNENK